MTQIHPMNVADLVATIKSGKPLFVLDVRNETDFSNGSIEGANLQTVNIPYFELLDGVEGIVRSIPDDKDVLVVCAKEGSSIFVAEQLANHLDREIQYLAGGMSAWSEHLDPVKIGNLSGGALYQFVRPGKGCLSYMVVSGGEALVVDAARMTAAYEQFAASLGATIRHVADTHLHADHISGGRALAAGTGAAYWLPPKDAEEVTFPYRPLTEGHSIAIGGTNVAAVPLHTPGHTIGSTTFLIDGRYLLTGDILFVESIGRPDLAGFAGDWADDLRATLYSTCKQLDDNLIVLPAHYGSIKELNRDGSVSARLGDLYERNAGLTVHDEAAFRKLVTDGLPPQPNAYEQIRRTNMGALQPSEEEQREMESGPNRCAVHPSA